MVASAAVSLLDSTRHEVLRVTSDRQGRYTLRAGGPGRYIVRAQKLGFTPSMSRWLRLEAGQTLDYEIALEVAPRQLDSVRITTRAADAPDESLSGMDVRTMAGDIINPVQVDQIRAGAANYLEVIGRVPNLNWIRPDTLCVRSLRSNGCLEIFLDDILIARPQDVVGQVMAHSGVALEQIHHIVLLRPAEAGVLYGTGSYNGVVLIYTKGRAALDSLRRVRRQRK